MGFFKEGFESVVKKYDHSSDPITKIAGMAAGKVYGSTKGAAAALVNDGFSGVKDFMKDENGNYSKSRIALTAFGAITVPSAAGRFISGGGLYRDDEGNFDIIGIPFI